MSIRCQQHSIIACINTLCTVWTCSIKTVVNDVPQTTSKYFSRVRLVVGYLGWVDFYLGYSKEYRYGIFHCLPTKTKARRGGARLCFIGDVRELLESQIWVLATNHRSPELQMAHKSAEGLDPTHITSFHIRPTSNTDHIKGLRRNCIKESRIYPGITQFFPRNNPS